MVCKRKARKIVRGMAALLAAWLLLGLSALASNTATDGQSGEVTEILLAAQSGETTEPPLLIMTRSVANVISSPEELLQMAEKPYEDYELACDIDMRGVEWKPFSFHGTFNGNGYSILNLTIGQTGEAVRETFDGNMKVYDTYFAGLFDEISGYEEGDMVQTATVVNLNLVNVRIDVETDLPCFIGSFAGYMEKATIENCTVSGILQLRAHDRMFGVGGIIGYGCGTIDNCTADVTLVCIDTDASTKDEQFMGGVCAAGYPDMHGNTITIAGYDSDHGYVHDGGLVGMYMFYPKGMKYKGSVKENYVSGKITFYEDNKNRRAYCNGFIGEIMNWDFDNVRNKNDFVRDEVYTYDVDLMPHSCTDPQMREEVTPAGCEFGYTTYICETCGYTEKDLYTLKDHAYEWTVVREATTEEEGLSEGVCKDCGDVCEKPIEKLVPTPEPTPVVFTAAGNGKGFSEIDLPIDHGDGASFRDDDKAGMAKGWRFITAVGVITVAVIVIGIAAIAAAVKKRKR
ncbi:MAG: hypothetical protein J5546_09920 [Lachnospiraceae bacterium]|nr:hypothetical protein [Lachnospiraceae bacterium]